MTAQLKIIDMENEDNNQTITIESDLLEQKANNFIINNYVKVLNNNKRLVRSSHYKSISGIQGSTRKIRPQKRVGRSRQGAAREIHMRGGAIKFGFSGNKEKDRHMRYRSKLQMNKKEKIIGQRHVLANKLSNNLITILKIPTARFKTKAVAPKIDQYLTDYKRASMIYSNSENVGEFMNIPSLSFQNISSLNILHMLKNPAMIFDLVSIELLLNKLKIKYQIN